MARELVNLTNLNEDLQAQVIDLPVVRKQYTVRTVVISNLWNNVTIIENFRRVVNQ